MLVIYSRTPCTSNPEWKSLARGLGRARNSCIFMAEEAVSSTMVKGKGRPGLLMLTRLNDVLLLYEIIILLHHYTSNRLQATISYRLSNILILMRLR